jgi:hypothetical protein
VRGTVQVVITVLGRGYFTIKGTMRERYTKVIKSYPANVKKRVSL